MKTFDFIYYYIFQLSRKGPKQDYHENTKNTLSFFIVPIYIALFALNIYPFLKLIININWGIFQVTTMFFSGVITYYLVESLYGKNGTRTNTVKEYDNKYNFKKTNKYFDTIILWLITILFIIFSTILFWIIKGYFMKLPISPRSP